MIENLLLVGSNDWRQGRPPQKIDMAGRSKYFSSSSWSEYQEYVDKQKNVLKGKYKQPDLKEEDIQLSANGHLESGKYKLIEKPKGARFSADGNFCYQAHDVERCADDKFHIDLFISGDLANPDDIIIDKWSIRFPDTE